MAEYIEKDAFIRSIEGNPYTTESVKSYIRVSVKKFPAADVRENTIRTQADRIRAMTDEELSEAFAQQMVGLVCRIATNLNKDIGAEKRFLLEQNKADWLNWLQSPAEGGDDHADAAD